MKLLFEKFKTSEFWALALSSGVSVYLMWRSEAVVTLHAVGLTIMLAGYMIARSFYKHMRAAAHVHGSLTSEFFFLLLGLGSFAFFVWQNQLSEGVAVLLGCILVCAYAISRGNAKRLSARPVPFL